MLILNKSIIIKLIDLLLFNLVKFSPNLLIFNLFNLCFLNSLKIKSLMAIFSKYFLNEFI